MYVLSIGVILVAPAALLLVAVALLLMLAALVALVALRWMAARPATRLRMAPGVGRGAGMKAMHGIVPHHGIVHLFLVTDVRHRCRMKILMREHHHPGARQPDVYKHAVIERV